MNKNPRKNISSVTGAPTYSAIHNKIFVPPVTSWIARAKSSVTELSMKLDAPTHNAKYTRNPAVDQATMRADGHRNAKYSRNEIPSRIRANKTHKLTATIEPIRVAYAMTPPLCESSFASFVSVS